MSNGQVKNIQGILQMVNKTRQHANEMARIKGENFNLFSILGMEYLENQTHSAFIGELLNPQGSHDMQDAFLKLFK